MIDPHPPAKKTLLIEDFPEDLKIRAKVLAMLKGQSLRQWAIAGITDAVERAEKAQALVKRALRKVKVKGKAKPAAP